MLNDSQKISPYLKTKSRKTLLHEKIIKYFFLFNGYIALLLLLMIFIFLFQEGIKAFDNLNLLDFLYSGAVSEEGSKEYLFQWYPTSEFSRFSLLPLIFGTLITAIPATLMSVVLGISVGIYLSEIASNRTREILKPFIELFTGIPTVILGFIMLVVGATLFNDFFQPVNRLNAFLASIGLSFIVIPIIASITEDALRSIPNEMRMASYALGATKWQTITRVIIPSAISGLSAATILGFGRAVGETMIVLMATGNAAEIHLNIFRSVRTMTATIAAEMGEVSHESEHYYALFVIGIVLFSVTFILNLFAELVISRMKKKVGTDG